MNEIDKLSDDTTMTFPERNCSGSASTPLLDDVNLMLDLSNMLTHCCKVTEDIFSHYVCYRFKLEVK